MLSKEEQDNLDLQASRVFRPAVPVTEDSLFAGRIDVLRQVIDAINQPGQHVLIFGERGVGKTSLANILASKLRTSTGSTVVAPRINCDRGDDFTSVWRKVFSAVQLLRQAPAVGFGTQVVTTPTPLDEDLPEKITTDDVRKRLTLLSQGERTIVIIDEFDRLNSERVKAMFSDTIKTLADHNVTVPVVLVGVADSVDELIKQHQSVGRALVQVPMPRMLPKELREIVAQGLKTLNMSIDPDALTKIASLSRGLPHYTHLLALNASREAIQNGELNVKMVHVESAIKKALKATNQSIRSAYHKAVTSPNKRSLFADVLLACALAETDELGYFPAAEVREPLRKITSKNYDIPSFARHLKDFSDTTRGEVLQRTGKTHRIRYRFTDPLMEPFVIMKGLSEERIPRDMLERAERPGKSRSYENAHST